MTNDQSRTPSNAGAIEHVGASAEQQILKARQIRLYIENTPEHVLGAFLTVAFIFILLWPNVPGERRTLVLWGAAVFATICVRLTAWVLFRRARPRDHAVPTWLKWFLVPQICSTMVIGASSFLFLPTLSGRDTEVLVFLGALVFFVTIGTSMQLSAYRPVVAPALAPMLLIFAAGLLRLLPAALPALFILFAFLAGRFAYRMSVRINRALVQSMELSVRNERLVAALEARTAELQRQTLALEHQSLLAEEARHAAERAEQAKTRFLAAASHDLRQPMHAISLMVGMLRPDAPDSQRVVVDHLERSVDAMDRLFSTILDLCKLDSGAVKPAFANVPLRVILDSIQVHFAPQASSKRLALRVFASRAIIRTDRELMERILRNLVSNAVKYTPKGRVLVGCRRRGARLLVGVWDTGVGISPADQRRIFDEYVQLGSSSRDRSEGLGLGLAIVQRLAKLLDSEIQVASLLGRGSCFGLEVPFDGYLTDDQETVADESAWASVLSGKLVLVVDDEADVRFGTETLLRQWGCHTACAASYEEVSTILERELRFPDLVITDYRIGGPKTGLDVIAAVRAYTNEQTPSIIVTGDDLAKMHLDGAACVPVIKKPLSAEQLRQHLVQYLMADVARAPRPPALKNQAR